MTVLTLPDGRVSIFDLSKAVDEAKARGVDVALIKTAREAVSAYSWGKGTYEAAARAVLALTDAQTQKSRPFVEGVVFVESSNAPGTFYRCVGSSCTCKAGSHGRTCKHLEAAASGKGWRAATLPAPADPFSRIGGAR